MFRHDNIEKLWQDIQDLPMHQKNGAMALLKILDSDEANVSSIFYGNDSHLKLAQINLRDHTEGVAREIVNKGDHRFSLQYGLAIIAALGHDFGKMARGGLKKSKNYRPQDHATASADILYWILVDYLNEKELNEIDTAVRFHHGSEGRSHTIAVKLKKADTDARIKEVFRLSVDPNSKEGQFYLRLSNESRTAWDKDWKPTKAENYQELDPASIKLPFFTAEEFLERALPLVNNRKAWTAGPQAISMKNDVIYLSEDAIFWVLEEWVKKEAPNYEGYLDILKNSPFNPYRRKDLLEFVGLKLKGIGALADHVMPENIRCTWSRFRVHFKNQQILQASYMPIKVRSMTDDFWRVENRKNNSKFANVTYIEHDYSDWRKEK